MVLGLLTSLLLMHYGQTCLWALEVLGDCWASQETAWQFCRPERGENLCQYFFHFLLHNRLKIFHKEKQFESGGDPTGHLVSLTPILQIKLQHRGQSNEELLKWRLVIIPLGTAEPHHFNGISMRGKPKANTWCHYCKCITV